MSRVGTEHSLLRYCARHLIRLRKRLPTVLKSWDPGDLHDVRVASRRLKSALEALKPIVSADKRKPVVKSLKTIRRKLGPLRDLDVMCAHLDSFKSSPRAAPGAEWLAAQFEEKRKDLRETIYRKLTRAHPLGQLKKWSSIESDLKKSFEAARLLVAKRATKDFRSFSRCAAELRNVNNLPGDQIHELRIAAKKLRYQLELAESAGYPLAPKTLTIFKRLQDTLGQWHDYVVLSEQALQTAVAAGLAYDDPELYEQVLSLAQQCAHRASHYLARFRETSELFGLEHDEVTPPRLHAVEAHDDATAED